MDHGGAPPLTLPDANSARFHPETDDVFSRIAADYDRYCDLFSFYIHRLWKGRFARQVIAEPGETCLDLASGTGDIALRVLKLARAGRRPLRVEVSDICQPMLDIARAKLGAFGSIPIRLVDACDMQEVPDASYDIITMAFGMKIIDRQRAMAEIYRCLKPGGVFLNIDAAVIPFPPLRWLYLRYMDFCMPLIGRLAARGDASAYGYLLRGVHGFPAQAAFAAELRTHGFADVSYQNLTLGIVATHRAKKPVGTV